MIDLALTPDSTGIVRFRSSISNECKYDLMASAYALLFSSATNRETLGIAQLEGSAHGLPVIVTDIPLSGVSEVVRKFKAA